MGNFGPAVSENEVGESRAFGVVALGAEGFGLFLGHSGGGRSLEIRHDLFRLVVGTGTVAGFTADAFAVEILALGVDDHITAQESLGHVALQTRFLFLRIAEAFFGGDCLGGVGTEGREGTRMLGAFPLLPLITGLGLMATLAFGCTDDFMGSNSILCITDELKSEKTQ